MPPQVGLVGATLKPRKISPASAVIARARLRLDRMGISANTLGMK